MSSPIFLLRSPAHTISQSLFLSEDPNIAVLGIEGAVTTIQSQSQPGEVLQPGDALVFGAGQRLTYKQLLDVFIKGRIVLTL